MAGRKKRKKHRDSKNKIAIVMREFKEGKLRTSSGKKVTDRKQAIAIALSEQRRYDAKKKRKKRKRKRKS